MFTYKSHNFDYFEHAYNNTRLNERAVEIAFANYFLNFFSSTDIVEIGCVTPHYFNTNHKVYDLFENHPKSTKQNGLSVNLTNKNAITISTIEHFGLSDYSNTDLNENDSYLMLDKITTNSNKYLITFPLGYNKNLDNYVYQNYLDKVFFVSRIANDRTNWKTFSYHDLTEDQKTYGTYHCANSVAIIENFL